MTGLSLNSGFLSPSSQNQDQPHINSSYTISPAASPPDSHESHSIQSQFSLNKDTDVTYTLLLPQSSQDIDDNSIQQSQSLKHYAKYNDPLIWDNDSYCNV